MIVIPEHFDKDNEAWEVWTRAWSYRSSRRPNGPSRRPRKGNEQSPLYISSDLTSLRRQVESPVRKSTSFALLRQNSLLLKPEDGYKSPVKSQCRYAGDIEARWTNTFSGLWPDSPWLLASALSDSMSETVLVRLVSVLLSVRSATLRAPTLPAYQHPCNPKEGACP